MRVHVHPWGFTDSHSCCSGNWAAKQSTHPGGVRISTLGTLPSYTIWACLSPLFILIARGRAAQEDDDADNNNNNNNNNFCIPLFKYTPKS